MVISAGCGVQSPPQAPAGATTISVVLTFDDGPLPADVADAAGSASREGLLDPLRAILTVLAEEAAQGVFYIRGPGTPEAGASLHGVFADGLRAIGEGGHILGYHAYNHGGPAWGPAWNLDTGDEAAMKQDLLDLRAYVEGCLSASGASPGIALSPVFRQPYGGGVLRWLGGERVAHDLGLTYHGYVIDSFDWTGNIDADPWVVARLPVGTEAEHLDFVRAHLAAAAAE